ncbi:MAG: hypothetical protein ACLUKN_13310 [Bacilli bacterium]
MSVENSSDFLTVVGDDFKAVFNKRNGWLSSYDFAWEKLITEKCASAFGARRQITTWAQSLPKSSQYGEQQPRE